MSTTNDCRTRLTLAVPGAGSGHGRASDLEQGGHRVSAGAGTWRLTFEQAVGDGWKKLKEWSFDQQAGVERELAALALSPADRATLLRDGQLELIR